jgi:uncharacterized protein YkwD
VRASDADAANRGRQNMLSLTNVDRAEHGRRALSLDATLSTYAEKHSRDMANRGYLFHTDDLAARLKGVHWSIGGENVGVGSSLESLEDAFMASKDHRENILRRAFDHSAIGIFRDADDNVWVTVIFYG